MELKYLKSEDVVTYWEELTQLLQLCFESSHAGSVPATFYEEKLKGLQRYLDEGKAYVVGAVEDGKLLGFCWFYEVGQGFQRRMHAAYSAVLAEGRGRQLFNLMDAEAQRKARELGISIMELHVSIENPAVINIHEKSHGYSVKAVIMEKNLLLDDDESRRENG